jgi:hypothetical protein
MQRGVVSDLNVIVMIGVIVYLYAASAELKTIAEWNNPPNGGVNYVVRISSHHGSGRRA